MDYGHGESFEGSKNPKGELGGGDVYSVDRHGQNMVAGQKGQALRISNLRDLWRHFISGFICNGKVKNKEVPRTAARISCMLMLLSF